MVILFVGFLKKILEYAEKFNTNEFVFCWDSRHAYRKWVYPDYKRARREGKTTEELSEIEIMFKQFVQLRRKILPELGFKNIYYQNIQRLSLHFF